MEQYFQNLFSCTFRGRTKVSPNFFLKGKYYSFTVLNKISSYSKKYFFKLFFFHELICLHDLKRYTSSILLNAQLASAFPLSAKIASRGIPPANCCAFLELRGRCYNRRLAQHASQSVGSGSITSNRRAFP